MTKIGYCRIGSGTIGDPTVPTTALAAVSSENLVCHKKGGTTTGINTLAATAVGVASRASLGTYVSDISDHPSSVAGFGGGMKSLTFKILARANRSWPGPAMLLDVSGRSRNGFSAPAVAWIGGGRLSMTGGSTGFVSAPGKTAQAPTQPRIEARFRLIYNGTTLLLGKWTGTASTSSYKLELVNGQLVYSYSNGTTMASATSDLLALYNYHERSDAVVAVEHLNNGTSSHTNIRFYFSVDDGATWRQFGGTTSLGSTVNVGTNTTALQIGPGTGEVFWSRVLNATNLVLLSEFDATSLPGAASQWGALADVWSVSNSLGATNPILVQSGDVPTWGLNLNTDVITDDSVYPLDTVNGCSVAVSVAASTNPAADLRLFVAYGSNTGLLMVMMTAAGKFRVVLGDNIFESAAVFGDTTILVDFNDSEVLAFANGVPMTRLTTGSIPVTLNITPSRMGDGSTNIATVLLTGLAVTDYRLTAVQQAFVTSILQG